MASHRWQLFDNFSDVTHCVKWLYCCFLHTSSRVRCFLITDSNVMVKVKFTL